mgnify:CR=1 FL=1
MHKIVNGEKVKLTEEEIVTLRRETQAAEIQKKRNRYRAQRALAYPSIEDQLDLIYHDGVSKWKEEIKRIKDKYPKPEL